MMMFFKIFLLIFFCDVHTHDGYGRYIIVSSFVYHIGNYDWCNLSISIKLQYESR